MKPVTSWTACPEDDRDFPGKGEPVVDGVAVRVRGGNWKVIPIKQAMKLLNGTKRK